MGYCVRLSWRCDSSSARALARRLGTGRIKHLATKTLWIQQLVARKIIVIDPVGGEVNLADLGTKLLPKSRLEWLREQCGLVEVPKKEGARVAAVGAESSTLDHMQANWLKVLIAVAATLPPMAGGSSTEVCEVTETSRALVPVTWTWSMSDGYVGVLIAGTALGFGIALLMVALRCWLCPCARPRWCRDQQRKDPDARLPSTTTREPAVPGDPPCVPPLEGEGEDDWLRDMNRRAALHGLAKARADRAASIRVADIWPEQLSEEETQRAMDASWERVRSRAESKRAAAPRKVSRTVMTQNQVKYTWHYQSPRFQPLGERDHGAWPE